MTRTPIFVLGVLAVSALLAGCTATSTGSAQPTGSATNSGSSAGAVPPISHPLDATKFIKSPCTTLTDADLSDLGVSSAVRSGNSDHQGSGCGWGDTDTTGAGNHSSVEWMTGNTDGLSDYYAQRSYQAYWQPTTVAGYPAVYGDVADIRAKGSCVINVGVNDHLYFFASYEADSAHVPQSCDLAKQAAADVIKNLGGGG